MAAIDHVFVLMLENRSFDHFFGLSGRASIPRPSDPAFRPGALDRTAHDPPHEFKDVNTQLADGAMTGFGPEAKLSFVPAQIPVITQLASEFVLFDNWYSSVPGPTWPNRFFIHCGSSGGLATSPTQFRSGGSVISPVSQFKFQNGSIYDRLNSRQEKWRVYHGDVHPQVLAVPGMSKAYLTSSDKFRPLYRVDPLLSDFATDVNAPVYEPVYTFIEPNYALQIFSQFRYGDSQHPVGLVSAGEKLIQYVYETLRNSPLWAKSALLITWDEHGGFYDHVKPPQAVPPGDTTYNRPTDGSDPGFAFNRLGVRVPTILVSPLAPKGRLGSDLFPDQAFDHTSVIKSVFENFGLGGQLTARDGAAPSWNSCLAANARPAGDTGPTKFSVPTAMPAAATEVLAAAPADLVAKKPVDGFLAGMSLIALDLDREIAKQSRKAPIANTKPQSISLYRKARTASLRDPHFRVSLVQYINEVGVRVQAHKLRKKLSKP